jgi:hypothetical protein
MYAFRSVQRKINDLEDDGDDYVSVKNTLIMLLYTTS